MIIDLDKYWMKRAICLAKKAENRGEVPVGAILLLDNLNIVQGYNSSIRNNDPTGHAEIIVLRKAGKIIRNYRLLNSTLYVTLEPCLMCLGAIINSRISRLVYGAQDSKIDKLDLWIQIMKNKTLLVTKNVLKDECIKLISSFFKKKRV